MAIIGVLHLCVKCLLLGRYTGFFPCQKEKIKSEHTLSLVVESVCLVAAETACNRCGFWDVAGRNGMESHWGVLDGTGSGILADISCFKLLSFAALILLLGTQCMGQWVLGRTRGKGVILVKVCVKYTLFQSNLLWGWWCC